MKIKATVFLIVLSILPGCSSHSSFPNFDEKPLLYANADAGMCGYRCANQGLIFVIWKDGKILRAISNDRLGHDYLLGTLSNTSLQTVHERIAALKRDNPKSNWVIDAPTRTLYLFEDSKVSNWSNSMPPADQPYVLEMIEQLQQIPMSSVRQFSWREIPRFEPPVDAPRKWTWDDE